MEITTRKGHMRVERKNPLPQIKGCVTSRVSPADNMQVMRIAKPYPYPSRFGSHASMIREEIPKVYQTTLVVKDFARVSHDEQEAMLRVFRNSFDGKVNQRVGSVSTLLVLQDELGAYITSPENLDNGLADPNRYCNREPVVLKKPVTKIKPVPVVEVPVVKVGLFSRFVSWLFQAK